MPFRTQQIKDLGVGGHTKQTKCRPYCMHGVDTLLTTGRVRAVNNSRVITHEYTDQVQVNVLYDDALCTDNCEVTTCFPGTLFLH